MTADQLAKLTALLTCDPFVAYERKDKKRQCPIQARYMTADEVKALAYDGYVEYRDRNDDVLYIVKVSDIVKRWKRSAVCHHVPYLHAVELFVVRL